MNKNFVVFDGIDGSGKSTITGHISEGDYFARALFTREPKSIILTCESIYNVLINPELDLCPETEMALVLASRAENINKVILPGLQKSHVFCDRFSESTMAYQGAGRGLGTYNIRDIVYNTMFYTQPDLTLIFDLPVEEAIKRSKSRGEQDKFDAETTGFMQRLRDYYLSIEGHGRGYVAIIDASLPVEQVVENTIKVLKRELEWN